MNENFHQRSFDYLIEMYNQCDIEDLNIDLESKDEIFEKENLSMPKRMDKFILKNFCDEKCFQKLQSFLLKNKRKLKDNFFQKFIDYYYTWGYNDGKYSLK